MGLVAKDKYELGISSLGGLIWYLQLCKLEETLLTRRMFELFFPPDAVAQDANVEKLPTLGLRRHMVRAFCHCEKI